MKNVIILALLLSTSCAKYRVDQEVRAGIRTKLKIVTCVKERLGFSGAWMEYECWHNNVTTETIDSVKCARYNQAKDLIEELNRINNINCEK